MSCRPALCTESVSCLSSSETPRSRTTSNPPRSAACSPHRSGKDAGVPWRHRWGFHLLFVVSEWKREDREGDRRCHCLLSQHIWLMLLFNHTEAANEKVNAAVEAFRVAKKKSNQCSELRRKFVVRVTSSQIKSLQDAQLSLIIHVVRKTNCWSRSRWKLC